MKRTLILCLLIVTIIAPAALAQTGIDVPSMHKCDTLIRNFLQTYHVNGATVAITKAGKLVYNRAFGNADQGQNEPMQPYHLQPNLLEEMKSTLSLYEVSSRRRRG